MNHLEKYGPKLIELGYDIIPLVHKKKFPKVKEWQKIKAKPSDIPGWIKKGYTGVGILCARTPAVDLDIRNEKLCNWMKVQVAAIAGEAPIRVGMPPKALLPFKTLRPFRKLASKKYIDPSDPWELDPMGGQMLKDGKPIVKTQQVEILGEGNQFVAFGIHDKTLKDYRWDTSLDDIIWDDLPTLGRNEANGIINVFEVECRGQGWEVHGAGKCVEFNIPFQNDGTKETFEKAATGLKLKTSAEPPYPTPPISPTPFPEVEGEAGVGNDAATPYSSFEEWDKAQDLDPGRLQLERYVIDRALADVDPEELDYDGWLKVGMALYHQLGAEEGKEAWYQWSTRSQKHNDDEMEMKWRSFAPEPGRRPTTFRTVLKMAEVTRKEQDVLKEYIDRYVYVESEDTVHDLYGPPHKSSPPLKNFRTRTASDELDLDVARPLKDDPDRVVSKAFPVCALWLKHLDMKWVSGETYYPNNGTGSRIKPIAGYDYLNTFRMPTFPAPVGIDPGIAGTHILPFLDHMIYLFPIEAERRWFIDWMALNLQHPDRRCKVTPLHISLHHGTGRGWLVSLLGKLLGSWNCTKTKMGDIVEGNWGNYLDKSLLCFLEEVHESGGKAYEVSEALRDILTEDMLQLNVKYGGIETKRVFTNFFFMSNKADALILKDTDRRINVFILKAKPKDNEYYQKLYGWSKGKGEGSGDEVATPGVCALWHWLMARDLSGFNWKTSVKSDSRKSLIASSENKVELYFREIMEIYPEKVITMKALKTIMGHKAEAEGDDPWEFENRKLERQISKMLQQNGWQAGGVVREKVLHRPWILGDYDPEALSFIKQGIRDMEKWVLNQKA